MIKFKISGIDGLKRKINQLSGRNIFTRTFQLSLGRLVRDIIYKRTKAGYGVSSLTQTDGTVKQKLAPLSSSYIAQRQGRIAFFTNKLGQTVPILAKNKPKLGEFGTPTKSNLTYTGQMLRNIEYKITTQGVDIFISNNKRTSDKLTNSEVAKFVQNAGQGRPARPFFNLTEDEFKILIRSVETEIRKITRRFS